MKSTLRILLIILSLASALAALDAQARTSQYSSASARHARASAGDRYPLGARDFYYQFSDSRVLVPGRDTGVTLAGGAAGLDLATQIDALAGDLTPTPQTGGMRTGSGESPRGGSAAADGMQVSAPMSAPRAPVSNFALPIAALGLMLFVARRRSVP